MVKICHVCGSTRVKMPPAGLDLRLTFPDYCEECGNRGIFPEVDASEVESFRKDLSKAKALL